MFFCVLSKIKVQINVRHLKAGYMTSSAENGLNIRTNTRPKMGQDQVSGEL